MNATLTITGDLETLAKAANLLNSNFPEGLATNLTPAPWNGWDVVGAEAVYKSLAHAAKTALEMTVAAGGFVPDVEVRAALDVDTLTGRITGPINKQIKRLQKEGVLPESVPAPITSGYPATKAWLRTEGFSMPKELVAIFAHVIA